MDERSASIPLGVVIRRQPGVTRWAKWVWRVVAVLPGAPSGAWRELRREGEAVEYHAATLPLVLYRTDTEAYRVALSGEPPSVYVTLRAAEHATPERPYDVCKVTVAPYETQLGLDSGEEILERVPMPPLLVDWVAAFVARHHREEAFIKRQRSPRTEGEAADGRGDARIRQPGDVYRSPGGKRKEGLH